MRKKARERTASIKREKAARPMRCGHHPDHRYRPIGGGTGCLACEREAALVATKAFEADLAAFRSNPPDRLTIHETSTGRALTFGLPRTRRPARRPL